MRRFLIFLLVGGGGFMIDAGITHLMLRWGFPPWIARLPAISCAMAFTWIGNRTLTYKVGASRSLAELVRYATAALMLAGFNYALFLGLVHQGLSALWALILATGTQVVLSFQIYKRVVFAPRESR